MALYQGTALAVLQNAATFKGFRQCLTNHKPGGFVSGHGFSHAAKNQKCVGLQPLRDALSRMQGLVDSSDIA
jgi:hypothetical protein